MSDAKGPSYFADRWMVFAVAELCREVEDTDALRRVQRNIIGGELRRIAAATEALSASALAGAKLEKN